MHILLHFFFKKKSELDGWMASTTDRLGVNPDSGETAGKGLRPAAASHFHRMEAAATGCERDDPRRAPGRGWALATAQHAPGSPSHQ